MASQIREESQRVITGATGSRLGARELADAYGALGQVLHVYEFFEPAELSYANAIRLAPGAAKWPHLLGYLYQQTGRLNDAVEQFTAARRIQPTDQAATVRLGDVYLDLNRLREAREEFESVREIFPALAQKGLGEVAIRERRFGDAARHFDLALQRVPTRDVAPLLPGDGVPRPGPGGRRKVAPGQARAGHDSDRRPGRGWPPGPGAWRARARGPRAAGLRRGPIQRGRGCVCQGGRRRAHERHAPCESRAGPPANGKHGRGDAGVSGGPAASIPPTSRPTPAGEGCWCGSTRTPKPFPTCKRPSIRLQTTRPSLDNWSERWFAWDEPMPPSPR